MSSREVSTETGQVHESEPSLYLPPTASRANQAINRKAPATRNKKAAPILRIEGLYPGRGFGFQRGVFLTHGREAPPALRLHAPTREPRLTPETREADRVGAVGAHLVDGPPPRRAQL